jgi:uncharacterized membrane protein
MNEYMNQYIIIIIILVLLLVIDVPVITIINNSMYKDQFIRINKEPINQNFRMYSAAIICYILLTLAIYYFVVVPELHSSNFDIIIKGMLLGLVIYGVYNTTNLATVNQFGIKEAIIDTMWGSILVGFIGFISIYLYKTYIL